jgi:hypothetical protein
MRRGQHPTMTTGRLMCRLPYWRARTIDTLCRWTPVADATLLSCDRVHALQRFETTRLPIEAQPNLTLFAALLEANLCDAQDSLISECIWSVDHDSVVALIEPMR